MKSDDYYHSRGIILVFDPLFTFNLGGLSSVRIACRAAFPDLMFVFLVSEKKSVLAPPTLKGQQQKTRPKSGNVAATKFRMKWERKEREQDRMNRY